MRVTGWFIFIVFFALIVPALAQNGSGFTTIKNLKDDWLVFKDNAWQRWEGEPVEAVYLSLSSADHAGTYLEVTTFREANVFVNQKLILQKKSGTILLSLDSLGRLYSANLTIGIFQKEKVMLNSASLVVHVGKSQVTGQQILPRKSSAFLNFSILAILMLVISFILLFRTNPRLTFDYLNVPKLFSVQEREDNLLTTRVTSSVNLLFYLFCSACCAYGLLAIFYLSADGVNGARYFPVYSTAAGFLQWTKLTIVIAVCLALKLVIIYSFATLFKLRDTAALQFFNFIRTLFFSVALISVVSLGYFVYYGYPEGPGVGLLKTSMVVLMVSVVMVFLKLLTMAPFRFFHLFSYLCASEIIPLMILLRILLY